MRAAADGGLEQEVNVSIMNPTRRTAQMAVWGVTTDGFETLSEKKTEKQVDEPAEQCMLHSFSSGLLRPDAPPLHPKKKQQQC